MNQNPAHHVADVVEGLGVEILLAESSTDFLRIAQSLREAARLCEKAAEDVFGQEPEPGIPVSAKNLDEIPWEGRVLSLGEIVRRFPHPSRPHDQDPME